MKKNFFISYNKSDKEWAQWLDWQIRSKGYSTFTQFGDIPWGSNFVARMNEGSKEAERMILVLSPDFLSSDYTEAEWTTMFTEDPRGARGLLLPIRVRECELAGLLAARVYLDLWEQDESGAALMLTTGLATLNVPATAGATIDGPAPPFPYLRYDYFVEFCDADAVRAEGLASQLESQRKKVWRDIWNVVGGVSARKKNPPASLRFGCRVVCAGDLTPDSWTQAEIRDALNQQRKDPVLTVMPVVFGSGLDTLRQTFADEIPYWADASNAIRLLVSAAGGSSLSEQGQAPKVTDPLEVFLTRLKQLEHLLSPDVVHEARLNVVKELQRETYGGR